MLVVRGGGGGGAQPGTVAASQPDASFGAASGVHCLSVRTQQWREPADQVKMPKPPTVARAAHAAADSTAPPRQMKGGVEFVQIMPQPSTAFVFGHGDKPPSPWVDTQKSPKKLQVVRQPPILHTLPKLYRKERKNDGGAGPRYSRSPEGQIAAPGSEV